MMKPLATLQAASFCSEVEVCLCNHLKVLNKEEDFHSYTKGLRTVKSHNDYRAVLYIMCGLPFAGKSTLAKEMVNLISIKRVSIDEINEEQGVWKDDTGMSPEEWTKTYEEAYQRISTFLEQGKSVVDDSANFTREQRDRLRAIAEQFHAQSYAIFVDVTLVEVQRRWQENRQTAVRNDVRDDDFAQVVENFEPPTENENVLRYDGSMMQGEWIRLNLLRKNA